MKKIQTTLLLVLAIVCLLFTLAGCGKKDNEPIGTAVPEITEPDPAAQTEDPIYTENLPDESDKNTRYTLKNYLMYKDDDYELEFVGIDESDTSMDIKFKFTNNTDTEAFFDIGTLSSDSFSFANGFHVYVDSGKSKTEAITLQKSMMDSYGLLPLDILTVEISIGSHTDVSTGVSFEREFTIYPTEKSPENVVHPQRATNKEEFVVLDNEKCTFTIIGTSNDEHFDDALAFTVYVENKTKQDLVFSLNSAKLNGKDVELYWGETVRPGEKTYAKITFFAENMYDAGLNIYEVTSFAGELGVTNPSDWSGRVIASEQFEYNINH